MNREAWQTRVLGVAEESDTQFSDLTIGQRKYPMDAGPCSSREFSVKEGGEVI